jgi:predicted dehydrogenase
MKILFVGLGSIGQRHARNLRRILGDDLELIAFRVRRLSHVVSPELGMDTSRNVEDELRCRTFTDLELALQEKPDVAFICNPNSMHIPPALACVKAGCDVFIEKPLSNSLEGVPELIRAVAEGGRIAMIGFHLRFHPAVLALNQALKDGLVGRPLSVRATMGEYMPHYHRYEDYRTTCPAQSSQGGGVILCQIHDIDYLYSLFGFPRRLYAVGGHWSSLEIDVEDTVSILMECMDGDRPLPVHLHQDFLQSPPSRQCEVIAENGKVTLDFPSLTLTIQIRDSKEPVIQSFAGLDRNQLFLSEIEHFLACVRNRQQPTVDLTEGLQSLRIALAAKDSIESRKLIHLTSENTYAASASL